MTGHIPFSFERQRHLRARGRADVRDEREAAVLCKRGLPWSPRDSPKKAKVRHVDGDSRDLKSAELSDNDRVSKFGSSASICISLCSVQTECGRRMCSLTLTKSEATIDA